MYYQERKIDIEKKPNYKNVMSKVMVMGRQKIIPPDDQESSPLLPS